MNYLNSVEKEESDSGASRQTPYYSDFYLGFRAGLSKDPYSSTVNSFKETANANN